MNNKMNAKETATLGAGCFWCVEAIFENFVGVEEVKAGYAGGDSEYPTYQEVAGGKSGHAEVVQITFDAQKISYREMLVIYFHAHDPTTLNRQGADVGSEYRSILFYHNEQQRLQILEVIKEIENQKLWSGPIVTEVREFKSFYPAEAYHQDYYRNNKSQPYCSIVIAPKLQKLYKQFAPKLR